MNGDNVTRLLLLGILVCLVALLVQGTGGADSAAPWGRYQVMGTRAGAPLLVRSDSVTGKVWKLELRGGDDRWQLFGEAGESDAQSAQAPAGEPERPEPPAQAPAPQEPAPPLAEETLSPEPPGPQGPRIKFAPRKPKPAPVAGEPQPLDVESIRGAVTREDLPAEIRIWAVNQLREQDDTQSTQLLLDALRAQDPGVSAAAADALAERSDEPGVAEALESAGY